LQQQLNRDGEGYRHSVAGGLCHHHFRVLGQPGYLHHQLWAGLRHILVKPTNFVACLGGSFALYYYSGLQPQACNQSGGGKYPWDHFAMND